MKKSPAVVGEYDSVSAAPEPLAETVKPLPDVMGEPFEAKSRRATSSPACGVAVNEIVPPAVMRTL